MQFARITGKESRHDSQGVLQLRSDGLIELSVTRKHKEGTSKQSAWMFIELDDLENLHKWIGRAFEYKKKMKEAESISNSIHWDDLK